MVSVIIPTYNRSHTLSKAIESVCRQTFSEWELLVVDDGSSDSTSELVGRLQDHRIRYVFQDHAGVSAARNRGVELARHGWLAFLDSDDCWKRSKLACQLSAAKKFPEYPAIFTNEIWIRNGRRVNQKKKHRKYGGWIYQKCLPLCIISPSSILIQKRLLEREGPFDEAFPVCEDYELWLRIAARNPLYFLDAPLIVKAGGHRDQLSRSRWGLDRFRVKALIKTYRSGRLTPLQQVWTAKEVENKASVLAAGYRNRGKEKQARRYRTLAEKWRSRPH